jgi:cysteine desulfurase
MNEAYLDNAATTAPWPEVVEAMTRAMGDGFGNASSLHRRGLDAARRIAAAADEVRRLAGWEGWKVVFTSGGSEADTMAVLGSAPRGRRDAVVTSALEHAAVEEACSLVAERGGRVVTVTGGAGGVVDPLELAAATDDRTALVSLTHVANELGTIQPVNEAARAVRRRSDRCRFHVDGVQAAAQLAQLSYCEQVDMVSLSAHKIHGPQGVGALLLRGDVRPRSLICGGDQQDRLRPGTLNLPGIVGFGEAARLTVERRAGGVVAMAALRDRLAAELTGAVDGVRALGAAGARAPGMLVLAVAGVRSQVLLHALEARGVLASAGSACHATRARPSRALEEAGLGPGEGALRLSLSLDTTEAQVEHAIGAVAQAVRAVRDGRAGAA